MPNIPAQPGEIEQKPKGKVFGLNDEQLAKIAVFDQMKALSQRQWETAQVGLNALISELAGTSFGINKDTNFHYEIDVEGKRITITEEEKTDGDSGLRPEKSVLQPDGQLLHDSGIDDNVPPEPIRRINKRK